MPAPVAPACALAVRAAGSAPAAVWRAETPWQGGVWKLPKNRRPNERGEHCSAMFVRGVANPNEQHPRYITGVFVRGSAVRLASCDPCVGVREHDASGVD